MIKVEQCFWCQSRDLKTVSKRKDGVGIQECQNCELLLVTEIPEDLTEYYDEEGYFNPEGETETGYHENYDLISPLYLYWQGALIEEVARRGGQKSVLEIGCATGNALEMMGSFNRDLSLYGIDLSSYAIEVCQKKGLPSSVSKIDDFQGEQKFGIIFSSETMEHVDTLHQFIDGVRRNLEPDGVYVFYVPAVDKGPLIEQGENYPSVTTSLEHVSYFTQSFLENALSKAFNAAVSVHRMSMAGENYHLGFVSANADLVAYLKKFIHSTETDKEFSGDPKTLYNLATIAAKFGRFDVADHYLENLKQTDAPAKDIQFLDGAIKYGKGELIKARQCFSEYLDAEPSSSLTLKMLLAIEKDLGKMLIQENDSLRQAKDQLQARVSNAEAHSADLEQSKIIRAAIVGRKAARKVTTPLRKAKKKIRSKSVNTFRKVVPRRARSAAKYVVHRRWRERHVTIDNQRYPADRPLVSVVIPYYNRAATIDETLASLRTQTFRRFEVILVNDGSTEPGSSEKLAHLNLSGLAAKIVNQENHGTAAARNTGVSLARGKYIVCLDSDDALAPTYLEKCLILLETDPKIALATTDEHFFGVQNLIWKQADYNAAHLLENNMVTTAAMFERQAWEKTGGYTSSIGYEDWEFWIHLAEKGYWGRNIAEPLFNYRTALESQYTADRANTRQHIQKIRSLHPRYLRNIRAVTREKSLITESLSRVSLFVNLDDPAAYAIPGNKLPNVLMTVPWMAFGGAETLIYNYCIEIRDQFNISFMTGLKSDHEWEYKFREITPSIYHLANLFEDRALYLEFISNYISTRHIDVLHIIHNGFMFDLLAEIRRRHPRLKVVVTMFNDRVEYFAQSVQYDHDIDAYITDNATVANHYREAIAPGKSVTIIPNGVNCYDNFSPTLYNRPRERTALGIAPDELAVYFIGRLSVEKNPDVFLEVARKLLADKSAAKLKFFVVGDGPMRPQVEKTIKAIRSPSITYMGYQSAIAKYLSSADIFVLPSSIEGFPLSILEAMAMEVAVVASDVGAVAEVIESGSDGFVVPAGSAPEIVATIKKLRADPELLARVQKAARQQVEQKYSNTILGQNYIKLYRELSK